MDYSFNGQYGFPWNPSTPFMPNQYNPTNATTNGFSNGQSTGNIQPFSASNTGGFNSQGVYGGPRFPPGMMPFGPFGPQNGTQNSQNNQFRSNWNFPYPNMNTFNQIHQQQPQQNVVPGNLNTVPSTSESAGVKKEVDTKPEPSDITDKIALKVTSMLAKSLQNNSKSLDEVQDDSDSATDIENDFIPNDIVNQSSYSTDLGITNSTLDLSYVQNNLKKKGTVP